MIRVALSALAAAYLASPSFEPQPRLDAVDAVAQAGQVHIRGFFRSPGNPDSNITTLYATGLPSQRHALVGAATRDSFTVARPAAGVTLTGQFCVQSTKRNWNPAPPVCRAWSYTEPAVLPPPVIDSVRTDTLVVAAFIVPTTRPIVLDPVPSDSTFCLVLQFANGSTGYRGPRTASCDAALALPVTAEGAAFLERHCMSWATTPIDPQGTALTVTPTEPCSGVARAEAR